MKATIVVLGLLAIAAAMAACGGSSSKTSTTPAASAAAPTSSSATKASGGATAAAPTSTAAAASDSGSGACKYLSDSDAATVLPNAGQAKVTSASTPAGNVTTCHWGTSAGFTNAVVVLVTELKIDAALAAAKESIDSSIEEKIDGLGDSGGFSAKAGADGIGVTFIKGKTTVLLSVGTAGANADAVAALAKKIAAKL
jgi:hypothetical protein